MKTSSFVFLKESSLKDFYSTGQSIESQAHKKAKQINRTHFCITAGHLVVSKPRGCAGGFFT
jgi:type II secretory pathway component PulC